MKNLYRLLSILLTFILLMSGNRAWAQTGSGGDQNDYRTVTGTATITSTAVFTNFQVRGAAANSWATATGTSMAVNLTSAKDLFVQPGANLVVAANCTVNNLNINQGSTVTVNTGITLYVNGVIRCYTASAPSPVANDVTCTDATPNVAGMIVTTGTGKITFIGATRTVGILGASNTFNSGNTAGWSMDIGMTAANTATLGADVSLGNLSVTTGILSSGVSLTGTGTLTLAASTTLTLTGTSAFPVFTGAKTINATSTVNYAGSTQDINAIPSANYGNLTVGAAGTKTFNATPIVVAGTCSVSAGTLTYGSTATIRNITVGNLVIMSGTTFDMAGTGAIANTLTINSTTVPLSVNNSGTFTPGTGSTVNYSAAAAQTIFAGTYNNLTISGSNTKTIPVASLTIAGTCSVQAGVCSLGTVCKSLLVQTDLVVASGASLGLGTAAITTSDTALIVKGTTWLLGTNGTIAYGLANQRVSLWGSLNATSATLTAATGIINMGTALTGTELRLKGAYNRLLTLTTNTASGTVFYDGRGDQEVALVQGATANARYYNLKLYGPGNKILLPCSTAAPSVVTVYAGAYKNFAVLGTLDIATAIFALTPTETVNWTGSTASACTTFSVTGATTFTGGVGPDPTVDFGLNAIENVTATFTGTIAGNTNFDLRTVKAHTLNINGATTSLTGFTLQTLSVAYPATSANPKPFIGTPSATVAFNTAAAHTIYESDYYPNLTITGNSRKTLNGQNKSYTVLGNLTLTTSVLDFTGNTGPNTLIVNGSLLTSTGTIDMSQGNSGLGYAHNLELKGLNSSGVAGTWVSLGSLLSSTTSTVTYSRTGANQFIFSSPNYRNVVLSGTGVKQLIPTSAAVSTFNVAGDLTVGANSVLSFGRIASATYSVSGTTTVNSGGTLRLGGVGAKTLTLYGDLAASSGTVEGDSVGLAHSLILKGANNSVGTFTTTAGLGSTVTYNNPKTSQTVFASPNYRNLAVSGVAFTSITIGSGTFTITGVTAGSFIAGDVVTVASIAAATTLSGGVNVLGQSFTVASVAGTTLTMTGTTTGPASGVGTLVGASVTSLGGDVAVNGTLTISPGKSLVVGN
ncbi:MAG: hypothetical protein V4543_14880, partial [Bacteroidota bacterium]